MQFLTFFLAAFGGAVVVTFNIRAMGGQISFFESVSILGYCIFPLFMFGGIIKLLEVVGFNHVLFKVILVFVGSLWGVYCTY
jgi:hypothetical protein